MNHVPKPWRVIRRAWSTRLWILASIIILAAPLVDLAVELSDGWSLAVQIVLRVLSGLLGLLGIWARVVKQKGFEDAEE